MSQTSSFGTPSRLRHVLSFDEATVHQTMRLRLVDLPGAEPGLDKKTRARAHIWELSSSFHCSIIGTCLSTAEMRAVLSKLGVTSAHTMSDHQVHGRGVQIAARNDFAGKLLNRTIDRRHKPFLDRFAKAGDAAALLALWAEARQNGEIPGSYWAVMTHSLATDDLLRTVFEDVHMLSHLVGAANRADIRRLNALEADNQALSDKVGRQQKQVKDLATANERLVSEIQRLMMAAPSPTPARSAVVEAASYPTLAPTLEGRLTKSLRRCERLEDRVKKLEVKLAEERASREAAEDKQRESNRELAALEYRLGAVTLTDTSEASLGNSIVLYVGGRTHHIPVLRQATEKLGATFLHHDGGEENNSRTLASQVSRADVIFFPVDCVSHEAVGILKKCCRQADKPFRPLRSSGLGSYLAAFMDLKPERSHVHREPQLSHT